MMTTVTANDVALYRIAEMMKKGWTIKSRSWKLFKEKSDDQCYICLENLDPLKHQLKMNCCNGRMHPGCAKKLIQSIELNNCPYCKQAVCFGKDDALLVNQM